MAQCVFNCPVPVGNIYAAIEECKEVVLVPTTCAQAENNWSILDAHHEVINLLRCKSLEGGDAMGYRYIEKLIVPVYFVSVAAGKLVGVDLANVILSVNGVQIYHTSRLFGPVRFEFDAAADKINFFDENNLATTQGNSENADLIDLIILK